MALMIILGAVAFAADKTAEPAPVLKSFTVSAQGTNYLTVKWKLESGKISGYKLYKYVKSTKQATLLETFTPDVTSYKIKSLKSGTDYCFRLRAFYKTKTETVNSKTLAVESYTTVPRITGLKLTKNEDYSQEITWDAIKGIKSYRIYYLSKKTGKYTFLGTKSTNVASFKTSPATAYTYKIKAEASVQGGKTMIYGKASAALETVTRSALIDTFSVKSKTDTTITFSWEAAKNVDGYRVYQYDAKEKKYKAVKTVKNALEVELIGFKSATQYSFKIRSFRNVDGTNVYSRYSSTLKVMTKPSATKVTQVADALNNGKVILSWSKVDRADGYLIYISSHKNSGFTLYKEVKADKLAATVTGVKNGEKQYVKIKAYASNGDSKIYGAYSKIISVYA